MAEAKCPICGRPARPRGKGGPFCSDRCRQVDLARWLDGAYAIPAQEEDAPGEEDGPTLDRGDGPG